ncbi:hypothetical protein Leryth_027330 [Lithospermum erythrorhizon]|nr:hypothetical protein Leryth_027330 [Lithospermum erythrorhizon]
MRPRGNGTFDQGVLGFVVELSSNASARGGLWIDVLNECLNGQTFKFGPQTNNVLALEVITGLGNVTSCSEDKNADLFYSVLGGLGQFGVITRARIPLEPAPQKVKYIKAFYSNFSALSKDQEHLISANRTFDYIEGFVIINETGTFFGLEVAKYFNLESINYDKLNSTMEIQIVAPEENVFYSMFLLFHANASSTGIDGLKFLNDRNKRILDFCEANQFGAKEYLPEYNTQEDWKAHFGPRWEAFVQRKLTYDPLGILSPGQNIFQKGNVRL